jgi:outer membrane lipoprotein-sorting protein
MDYLYSWQLVNSYFLAAKKPTHVRLVIEFISTRFEEISKTMIRCLIYILLIPLSSAKVITGPELVKKMYEKYHDKWYKTLTFVQTTERYRNDSLVNTSTWYEAVMFPDKFRIDFGDPINGNAVLFRNDSVFNFQHGELKKATRQKNDLTFLLGGMYFVSIDSVFKGLKDLHYDLQKFHEEEWKGRPVYVIGAGSHDEKLNQLWIDKEKLILLRLIKYDDNSKEDAIFENHIQLGGGWSETACTFYINDQLLQKEYYKDCQPNAPLDPGLFDPSLFGKLHWYHGKK